MHRLLSIGMILATLGSPALASIETLTCQEEGPIGEAFKLEINWAAQLATISRKVGQVWTKQFAKSTVARNSPDDLSLLAEGTVGNYVGRLSTNCGGLVEQLFFDLAAVGNSRDGTVTAEQIWIKKPGAARNCRPTNRMPEPLTSIYNVKCQ